MKRLFLFSQVILILFLFGCKQSLLQEFQSREGKFSVKFPGNPTDKTVTLNTHYGPIDFRYFEVLKNNVGYFVSYYECYECSDRLVEELDSDQILDQARDGAINTLQGRLLYETIINLDGHPGREFKAETYSGEVTIKARVFLAGKRIYVVLISTLREKYYVNSENISIFLDSFKILR